MGMQIYSFIYYDILIIQLLIINGNHLFMQYCSLVNNSSFIEEELRFIAGWRSSIWEGPMKQVVYHKFVSE